VPIQGKCTHEDLLALGNILESGVVHTTGSCGNDICWTMRWMVEMALWTRSGIQPWCSTVSSEVASVTTIVAGEGNYAHFCDGGRNTVGGGVIALGTTF
jgi:hypothetical protein